MSRVFLFVLDSCGIGAMPDAADFGDFECDTLHRIATHPSFSADTVRRFGLGNVEGVRYLGANPLPLAACGRMAERSAGKDTITGHWELAGAISRHPMPTYPNGFPDEVLKTVTRVSGRGILCNRPYSGTEVIRDYGREHEETGKLIVYTSTDSVLQIAAHEAVVPPAQLQAYCEAIRKALPAEHAVGRVIARPFVGEYPRYTRTGNRRDYALLPPSRTMLQAIAEAGQTVIAVGKINDIFSGGGVTEYREAHFNDEGMAVAAQVVEEPWEQGLCFINLADFDVLYGHRQDVAGYAAAFAKFDTFLGQFITRLRPDDWVIVTADHGCDPGDTSTNHTREYVPLCVYGKTVMPVPLGTRRTFADVAASVTAYLGVPFVCEGTEFLSQIRGN